MADIEADTLLPSPRMREQALEGEVKQIHRGQSYAEEGDRFSIEETTFELVEIRERTLGEMTDEDARKEGVEDLEAYKQLLERAHDHFEWDDESDVVLHRFERLD